MKWVYHSEATFAADHALTLYQGKAEASHHHVWKVAIEVQATRLQPEYFALDFHAVHDALQAVTATLDGLDLNRHSRIGTPSPTAERVAEYVAEELAPRTTELGGKLAKVSVWESPENRVDLVL